MHGQNHIKYIHTYVTNKYIHTKYVVRTYIQTDRHIANTIKIILHILVTETPKCCYRTTTTQPLKMELIQGSETSANYNLTPRKYPEENIQYSNHGESLKSRIYILLSQDFQIVC